MRLWPALAIRRVWYARSLVPVLSILLVMSLMGVTGLSVAALSQPGPWDPLGEFPIQTIGVPAQHQSITVNGTTVSAYVVDYLIGQVPVIPVAATKCNATTASVRVEGFSTWFAVEPPGTLIDGNSGIAMRLPGCTTFHYRNPLPPEVLDRVLTLHMHGQDLSIWQYQGKEIPIDAKGNRGKERLWVTENFVIRWTA